MLLGGPRSLQWGADGSGRVGYFVTVLAWPQAVLAFGQPPSHAAWGLHPSDAGFASPRQWQDVSFDGAHEVVTFGCVQPDFVTRTHDALPDWQVTEALPHAGSPSVAPQVSGLALARSHGQHASGAFASSIQLVMIGFRDAGGFAISVTARSP